MNNSIISEVSNQHLTVRFPDLDETLEQDREYCFLNENGFERKIRFHDYDQIFEITGLYEMIFYQKLKCNSPRTVCGYLEEQVKQSGESMDSLAVLDVGAGNGMVGEQLKCSGVKKVIGVDIIQEAKQAALRDRPGIYKEYFVEDLTQLSNPVRHRLQQENLNCLTTVAALGFGDIPPLAFAEAYNHISPDGWLAFNIKETFLTDTDPSGFCKLIRTMMRQGYINTLVTERYRHRLAMDDTPLYYVAFVGRKQKNIPLELLNHLS
ncbi:MAG: class I SAM-dependent DNA methyltransferase [bacterium]|jgi:predicted TPR repeat methyltransferase